MQFRPLSIRGAFQITPVLHSDTRGVFLEWFKERAFGEAVGASFNLRQANCSVSAAGVVRGIHYADVPPGQPKYVTCVVGAFLDVVVDLRIGSSTFGRWDAVLLDDTNRRAVYIGNGLGHAVMALQDDSTLIYLCGESYAPEREHEIHALDPQIGIIWPQSDRYGRPLTPSMSPKDCNAPTLAEALKAGLLPHVNVGS